MNIIKRLKLFFIAALFVAASAVTRAVYVYHAGPINPDGVALYSSYEKYSMGPFGFEYDRGSVVSFSQNLFQAFSDYTIYDKQTTWGHLEARGFDHLDSQLGQ